MLPECLLQRVHQDPTYADVVYQNTCVLSLFNRLGDITVGVMPLVTLVRG